MSDISKKDLKAEISKILKDANLKLISSKQVRQKLEKVFKTDLTERKPDIDKLVMEYARKNRKSEDDEEKDDEDEEEEEEQEKEEAKEEEEEDEDEEEEEEEKPAKRGKREAPTRKSKPAKRRKADDDSDDKDSDYEVSKRDSDDSDEPKKKKGGKGKKAGRGKGSGYTRPYKLSTPLSALMGAEELPRHEVVKRVWAYIKEKNLFDPSNKHFAICDEGLYKVIGTKRFRAFGMMKYLKSHFVDA